MAVVKKYLHDLDLVRNKLLNPILNPLTSFQRLGLTLSVSDKGYTVYDITLDALYFWTGSTWVTGGGISTIPTLQEVTDAGFTTNNNIELVSGGGLVMNSGLISFSTDLINTGLLGSEVLTALRNWSFPDASGIIPLTVNGVAALSDGSITIPVGGSQNLQQVVNLGNGISNFGGLGNASIQSTNFTNGRTLLLNDNSAPAIKIVDNNNASNYLQIDIDTLNIDGTSYNWSSIVNPPTGTLVALPFTTDHLTITNNEYVVGDIVYYVGNVYRCIANNDSLQPNLAPAYWTLLGAGFPLVQQPSDWNSTSGNNQILNKPTIPTGTVTSVGLSMPSAFSVANSPVTSSGTLTVTGAGTAAQYVRGDGALGTFPNSPSGGGSSISYYLNGSIAASVIGYQQMSKTPVLGAGTDYTTATNGLIAQFLTDVGDPAFLNIPGGSWLVDLYFQVSAAGGTPSFYVELYKYNGSTFTLLSTTVTNPEIISNGTAVDLYITSLAVPTTTLTLTDRLAIRVFVNCDGKTLTLHTEADNLCQIVTTFSTGLSSLNGLTAQVQNFAVGTSGTDFNILSVTDTHTFNLPNASASNRGALISADWTTFNGKQNALSGTGIVKSTVGTISYLTDNTANWDTAYTNRITSLTTTGSGAATLVSNVLNIPTPPTATFTSLTTTGSSGASTLLSGVLNVPTYTLSGLGGQPLATNLTSVSALAYVSPSFVKMTAAGTFTLDTNTYITSAVTSVATTAPITGGTITNTGTIGITQAGSATDGYLSQGDWNIFNNKVGTGRNIGTTAPLAGGGDLSADRTLSITQAATGTDGYVSSTDWNTFNNKLSNNAWVDYSGTSTIVGFTTFAIKKLQYKVTAPDTMIVMFEITSTAANGSGTATSFTIPFPASAWGTQYNAYRFQNNVTQAIGMCTIAAGSNVVTFYPGGTVANWTTATTRQIQGVITINI